MGFHDTTMSIIPILHFYMNFKAKWLLHINTCIAKFRFEIVSLPVDVEGIRYFVSEHWQFLDKILDWYLIP